MHYSNLAPPDVQRDRQTDINNTCFFLEELCSEFKSCKQYPSRTSCSNQKVEETAVFIHLLFVFLLIGPPSPSTCFYEHFEVAYEKTQMKQEKLENEKKVEILFLEFLSMTEVEKLSYRIFLKS